MGEGGTAGFTRLPKQQEPEGRAGDGKGSDDGLTRLAGHNFQRAGGETYLSNYSPGVLLQTQKWLHEINEYNSKQILES